MPIIAVAATLHLLSAVVWVGGMFFAFMALRPACGMLDAPHKLGLWVRTFGHFFPWVWTAIILLLTTGFWMLFAVYGGMKGAGVHLHAMLGIGIVMMLIFMHLFFAPFRRLKRRVAAGDTDAAMRDLDQIRTLVGINLTLGIITVIIASAGRFLR